MSSNQQTRLQRVQPPETGHANLPVSVRTSMDGEESASVYNRRLQQSNISAKISGCAIRDQIPPNRTVLMDCTQTDFRLNLSYNHSQSTSTSPTTSAGFKQPCSRTIDAVGLTPVRRPVQPLSPCLSRELSSDYVSSSELSGWCGIRSVKDKPLPPLPTDESSDSVEDREHGAAHKERSSSADCLCRRLVRFTRQLRTRTRASRYCGSREETFSTKPNISLLDGTASDVKDKEMSSVSSWDLPPDYVDMIFTKNINANKSKYKERLNENHSVVSSSGNNNISSPEV